MNQSSSFIGTSLRFYIALAILEPQVYVVVEQFGAENISLLSGRLVTRNDQLQSFLKNRQTNDKVT